jgi:predicted 3-demethylubiquinone-9 3-methyltransferase (glyoxalase superfamily)
MNKITPFLWFNDNAEEAIKLYTSIFKEAKIGKMTRYDETASKAAGRPAGSVMTATFSLFGQEFIALNGGPHFKFNEAISFVVNCETQEEVDYYWENLTKDGGEESQCGWLKDKFGLSWQIVPAVLGKLLSDARTSKAVMMAMLPMKKLDIATLENAGRQTA